MNKEKRNEVDKIDRKVITDFFNSLFINSRFEYKTNEYEGIDMCATGCTLLNQKTYDIEIKSRNIRYNKYNNCFLECKKYEAIKSNKYTNEGKIYIAIYHKDDKIVLWDLGKIDNIKQYETKRWMNNETCSDYTKKVLKDVYEIPFDCGILYDFDCRELYKEIG